MHRSSWKASGFSASSPIDFLMRQVSPGPESPDRVALWSFCSFIFVLNIFAFVKLFANIHPWAVIMVNQVSTTYTILLEKSQLLKIRSKRQDFPKDWDEPLGRSSEPLGSRSSSKESGISRAAESRTKSSKDALKQLKQLWWHQICLKLTKRIQFSADNYWSSFIKLFLWHHFRSCWQRAALSFAEISHASTICLYILHHFTVQQRKLRWDTSNVQSYEKKTQ